MSFFDSPVAFAYRGPREQATIAAEPLQQRHLPDGALWTQIYRRPAGYLLRFPELADFELTADGRSIQAWSAPAASQATIEHLYLNQARPLALARQGRLVLHASAVVSEGGCIAFMGDSGQGKSTLAASFAASGTAFLTDDALQVEARGDDIVVIPSHPSIRLWEDSQTALANRAAAAAAVSYTRKTRLLAGEQLAYCAHPRVLRAIYFLGDDADLRIEPVRPAAAVPQLVRYSFLLDVTEPQALAQHFEAISRIAARVVHYDLRYPRRFESLAEVRAAVKRHLQSIEQP